MVLIGIYESFVPPHLSPLKGLRCLHRAARRMVNFPDLHFRTTRLTVNSCTLRTSSPDSARSGTAALFISPPRVQYARVRFGGPPLLLEGARFGTLVSPIVKSLTRLERAYRIHAKGSVTSRIVHIRTYLHDSTATLTDRVRTYLVIIGFSSLATKPIYSQLEQPSDDSNPPPFPTYSADT